VQLNIVKNNDQREGMVYPQTFFHRIKKPEENSLHKTEAIFFRFCPHGGNNPIHLLRGLFGKKT
jgi:hypothetical protein